MSTGTGIEWTEATWNPIGGCTPVSPGCLNCYAATMAYRLEKMGQEKYRGLTVLRNGVRTFNGRISFDEPALMIPLKRKTPTVYFVNSMSDLFHKDVPFEFVDRVFAVMALCPQHTFQVLTKRPERMAEYLTATVRVNPPKSSRPVDVCAAHRTIRAVTNAIAEQRSGGGAWRENYNNLWPLPNVWLGTSVENQEAADQRIPHLLKCPAAVRFLSCEPLLGPIKIPWQAWGTNLNDYEQLIHWVIIGGESGGAARVCYTDWFDEIVAQCKTADVAVFVKQLGANHRCVDEEMGDVQIKLKDGKGGDISEFPADLRIRQFPKTKAMASC